MEENKKELAKLRRQGLKKLCKALKEMVAMGELQASEEQTMNGLLRNYYAQSGHTELKTFKEWKDDGYIVKKGEKAILLWARPKATKEAKEHAKEKGKDETEAKEDYFPLAYVFSQKQVHKLENA